MELPSENLEQITFNTRPKIEENMFTVTDKSTHEEHLSQPFPTIIKQFQIAVAFLTGYNGTFNVKDKKKKFYFPRSINDDDFNVMAILKGAYELESLNDEIIRIIIKEAYFTEEIYPFVIRSKLFYFR